MNDDFKNYIQLLIDNKDKIIHLPEKDIQNLLDYITNLQEQLHQASLDIQELTERDIECPSWCDKLTNLQQENERIKKMNMHEHKYGSDMEGNYIVEKAKNDKAIEYIEKQYELIKDSDERWQPVLDNKKLLNILRGKEK